MKYLAKAKRLGPVTTVAIIVLLLSTAVIVVASGPNAVRPQPSPPPAAPQAPCGTIFPPNCGCDNGNVDGDLAGIVDITDLSLLIDYCFLNPGVGPINLAGAQIDGFRNPVYGCEPTGGDVYRLIDYLYVNFCAPDCRQRAAGSGGSGMQFVYNPSLQTFGPGTYSISRTVRLRKPASSAAYCVGGATFPIEVQFGGTAPTGLTIVPTVLTTKWGTQNGVIPRPGNRFVGYFYGIPTTLPAGFMVEPLCILSVSVSRCPWVALQLYS